MSNNYENVNIESLTSVGLLYYLNLPEQVQFGANDNLRYTYDAAGNKLVKVVDGTVSGNNTRLDYSGNFVYENDELKAIFTSAGRIVPFDNGSETVYKFEYNLQDHLGNTRVVFSGHSNGRPELMQVTDYYPFGMVMNQQNYFANGVLSNKYLYNNKELQDDELAGNSLGWYDYGARFYDAELGRWHVIDNKAEKYYSNTPYAYAANNPIRFIDPDGNEIVDAKGKVIYTAKSGWVKNAPSDAVRLGNAMMNTRTGTAQFNKMVNAKYGITLNISQENRTTKIGSKTRYLLGNADKSVRYDSSTGDFKVLSVDVTVFEGTIKEYLKNSSTTKADAYRESTNSIDQAIGAVGAHESVHTTDRQNIEESVENTVKGTTHDVEKEPVKVEMQVLQEQHMQNMKKMESITTINF